MSERFSAKDREHFGNTMEMFLNSHVNITISDEDTFIMLYRGIFKDSDGNNVDPKVVEAILGNISNILPAIFSAAAPYVHKDPNERTSVCGREIEDEIEEALSGLRADLEEQDDANDEEETP